MVWFCSLEPTWKPNWLYGSKLQNCVTWQLEAQLSLKKLLLRHTLALPREWTSHVCLYSVKAPCRCGLKFSLSANYCRIFSFILNLGLQIFGLLEIKRYFFTSWFIRIRIGLQLHREKRCWCIVWETRPRPLCIFHVMACMGFMLNYLFLINLKWNAIAGEGKKNENLLI